VATKSHCGSILLTTYKEYRMSIITKGKDLQEFLRTVNCLVRDDFEKMYGYDWEHYQAKCTKLGVFSFISYLDNDNLETLYKHVNKKIAARDTSIENLKKPKDLAKFFKLRISSTDCGDYNAMLEKLRGMEVECLDLINLDMTPWQQTYLIELWTRLNY